MPSRTAYGALSKEERKRLVGGKLRQYGAGPTNPLIVPQRVTVPDPRIESVEDRGEVRVTRFKAPQTEAEWDKVRKETARLKAEQEGDSAPASPPPPPSRPVIASSSSTSSSSSEEFEEEEYEEGGGIGRPRVPRPPGSSNIRQRVTERRRDRPTNYKIHVITALSLAFAIRVAALGKKSLGLP